MADEFQVFEPLVVAVVSGCCNHLCCSSLYLLYSINVLSYVWGTEQHSIFEIWTTRDLYVRRIIFSVHEVAGNEHSMLICVLILFYVCI